MKNVKWAQLNGRQKSPLFLWIGVNSVNEKEIYLSLFVQWLHTIHHKNENNKTKRFILNTKCWKRALNDYRCYYLLAKRSSVFFSLVSVWNDKMEIFSWTRRMFFDGVSMAKPRPLCPHTRQINQKMCVHKQLFMYVQLNFYIQNFKVLIISCLFCSLLPILHCLFQLLFGCGSRYINGVLFFLIHIFHVLDCFQLFV